MKIPLSSREKLLLSLLSVSLIFSSFSFSYALVSQSKVDSIMKMITDGEMKFSDTPASGQSKSERTQYYEKVDAGLGDAVGMLATVRNNIRALMGLSPAYTADDVVAGIVGGIIGGGTVGGGNTTSSGTTRVCKMVQSPPNPNTSFTCQGVSISKTFANITEAIADKGFHQGAAMYIRGVMIKSGFGPGISCTQASTEGTKEECTNIGAVLPSPGEACPSTPVGARKIDTFASDRTKSWHSAATENGINYWEFAPGGWKTTSSDGGIGSAGITIMWSSVITGKQSPDAPNGVYTCDGKDKNKCSVIGRAYVTRCPGYVSTNPANDPRVALYFDEPDLAYGSNSIELYPVAKSSKIIQKKGNFRNNSADLPGLDDGVPWYLVVDQKYAEPGINPVPRSLSVRKNGRND